MGLDIDGLKNELKEQSTVTGGSLYYTLQNGDNMLRFLPTSKAYFTGVVPMALSYHLHYLGKIEGTKFDKTTTVICLNSAHLPPEKRQPCPICQFANKLYKSGDASDRALASDIYKKKKYLFNVVNVNAIADGIKILETGPMIFKKLGTFVTSSDWGDLLSPTEGRNVNVKKTVPHNPNDFVSYDVIPSPNITDITPMLPEGWQDMLDNITRGLKDPMTLEQLTVLFNEYIDTLYGNISGNSTASIYAVNTPQPQPVSQPQPVASSQLQPAPQFTPQPQVNIASQPTPQPTPRPIPQPNPQPNPQPTPQPTPQPQVSAAPQPTPQPQASPPPTPQPTPQPKVNADGKPECFGINYRPSEERCKSCSFCNECALEFLNDD